MKEALRHIVTKNDFTAIALTNKIIANAIQNVVFDSNKDVSKEQIIQSLRISLGLNSSSYDELIKNGFSYAEENGLIKSRGSKFNISTTQREHINRQRQARDTRIQEVIEMHFKDCDANCNDIRSWLIDALEIFFKTYSREWISDVTRKTSSLASARSSIFDLIKRRTKSSTKFNLSDSDKNNLPEKFIEVVNTNSTTVNSLLAEYGLLAFSTSLLSAATTIDRLTIDAFTGCTFVLDTNILFNLNLENGIYYNYLPAIKSVFNELNIKAVVLPCTVDEYEHVLNDQKRNIAQTLDNYPNKIGLLKEMKDNAVVQTALNRHCTKAEDFDTFIGEIYDIKSFPDEVLCPEIIELSEECKNIEKEIETDKTTQSGYNDFFTDFTSHPKRSAPLEHDVKLLKIAQQMREQGKVFVLTDDSPLHRYTLDKMPKKDGQPLALRIITLISLLALQKDEIWSNDNNYDKLFSLLLRKDLFPTERIISFDDLEFMYEHDQAISKLSEEDIIRIGQKYSSKRLSEDEADTQIFLSREIAKTNKGYYADLTQAQANLISVNDELLRQKSTASTASKALRQRIEAEVKYENMRHYKFIRRWYVHAPIILAFLIGIVLIVLKYNNYISMTSAITSLLISVLAAAIWEIVLGVPKLKELKFNQKANLLKEIEERLLRELEIDK